MTTQTKSLSPHHVALFCAFLLTACSRPSGGGGGSSQPPTDQKKSPDGFVVADAVTDFELRPADHFEGSILKPDAPAGRRDFDESQRGQTMILRYMHDNQGITGVALLQDIPGHPACDAMAQCPEADITQANDTMGAVTIKIPTTGDVPAFKVRGRNQVTPLEIVIRVKTTDGRDDALSGQDYKLCSANADDNYQTALSQIQRQTTLGSASLAVQTTPTIELVPNLNERFCVHVVGAEKLGGQLFKSGVLNPATDSSGQIVPDAYTTNIAWITRDALPTPGYKFAIADVNQEPIGATRPIASAACAALTIDHANAGQWRLPTIMEFLQLGAYLADQSWGQYGRGSFTSTSRNAGYESPYSFGVNLYGKNFNGTANFDYGYVGTSSDTQGLPRYGVICVRN